MQKLCRLGGFWVNEKFGSPGPSSFSTAFPDHRSPCSSAGSISNPAKNPETLLCNWGHSSLSSRSPYCMQKSAILTSFPGLHASYSVINAFQLVTFFSTKSSCGWSLCLVKNSCNETSDKIVQQVVTKEDVLTICIAMFPGHAWPPPVFWCSCCAIKSGGVKWLGMKLHRICI